MLNSFATDSLAKGKEETKDDKMKQGWVKLKGLFRAKGNSIDPNSPGGRVKPSITDIVEELKRQQKAADDGDVEITENKSARSSIGEVEGMYNF